MAFDPATVSPKVIDWFKPGSKNRVITAGAVSKKRLTDNPEVQQFMMDLGLINPRTGLADPAKVRALQTQLGIPADGKFGPQTFGALMGGGTQPGAQPGDQQPIVPNPAAVAQVQADFPGIKSATADVPATVPAQRIQSDFPGIQPAA